jgi:hypothetical protein
MSAPSPKPTFRPPQTPPSHTGSLWLNPDKTIGGIISDVFNEPIHFVATKEGSEYRVRGWRGVGPEFRRLPIEGAPREDGLPDGAPSDCCPKCEGRLYWRASVISGGGSGVWRCATCAPADSSLWLDGLAVPPPSSSKSTIAATPPPKPTPPPPKEGSLL